MQLGRPRWTQLRQPRYWNGDAGGARAPRRRRYNLTIMAALVFEVFEDESGGYHAHAKADSHDLFTQAETLDELRRNLDEVSQLYLESLIEESGEPMPEGIEYSMTFKGHIRIPA